MSDSADGKDWSQLELSDLRSCAERGLTLEGASAVLSRDVLDVARKAKELGITLLPADRGHLPRL